MAENNIALLVQGLTISFGRDEQKFIAVNNISFDITKGQTLAVVGESGSGKSLTALALMGLLPANAQQQGSIVLQKQNTALQLHTLAAKEWSEVRGRNIGMVFQEPMSSLNPVMKIGKQLQESILTHQRISSEAAKNLAIEWLRNVQLPQPEKLYSRYPHQLSGGQKQRVMIAMAMCNNPMLLIADEPTTALDVTVQKEVTDLMLQLQKQHGTSMIFITHDLALAATIADDILVMYKGNIVEQGTASSVLNNPVHPYTKALLSCRPNPGLKNKRLPIVADFLDADKSKSQQAITDVPQQTSVVTNDVLLKVNNLKVWFAESKGWFGKTEHYYKAVNDVSFELCKGEVLGLVGESGCGKSTVSRSLLGLLPVREGEILFDNKDLAKISDKEWNIVRRDIQLIFQDPYASLNPRMTVGQILMEVMKYHKIASGRQLRIEAKRLLGMVHLPENAFDKYPHEFSGGQRQRIGIARALALKPKLLICDESVSALDVSVQAQILNLLKELQHEFQLSYLFISHDLSVVHYIGDRVLVMKQGEIVERGDAEKVLTNPETQYTRSLIDAMPVIRHSA
jgi:peptide/nickel transport system ATP-binding protein